jgi:hypothetical protein
MTTCLMPVIGARRTAIKRAPPASPAVRRRADGTPIAFASCRRRKKLEDGHAAIAYGDGSHQGSRHQSACKAS